MKSFYAFIVLSIAIVCGTDLLAQPTSAVPRDSPYDEFLEVERKILPYDHIREADVFWRKRIWRVIDVREKLNLPFAYPKKPFAQVLYDAVMSETIQVYDVNDDEFLEVIRPDELQARLNKRDSNYTESPLTGNDTMIISVQEFDPMQVIKYRIKEDWVFDENRSAMTVRILGIAPVMNVIDAATGESRGDSYLFWIYYPDARDMFANNYAFNPGNDAVQLSWEDIFEARIFSSYIVKESNVFDRLIESYTTKFDAVLESERIKKELFRKEHELWSY